MEEKIYKEFMLYGKKVGRWVKKNKTTEYEYDACGNEIHYKDSDGHEKWYEYNSNGKLTHSKDSDGYEKWHEYDENGSLIYYKYISFNEENKNKEIFYEIEYDSNGKSNKIIEYINFE